VLNEQIEHLRLLDDSERKTFLQEILGYRFVQTTGDWKPIQAEDNASPSKDLALIEGIAKLEDQTPALISSQGAIGEYQRNGLDEITETVEHYNNFKGLNILGPERSGIVLGCPFPPDDKIEKWAALAGESAKRKEADGRVIRGSQTDFGAFGNEVMHTFVHDEVFQAAMRFGREEVNGERGATVYLHTSAIPSWLPVEIQIPDIHSWTRRKEGMRKTVEAIREIEDWRTRLWKTTDVYPQVSEIKNRTVRNCLDTLTEQEYIEFTGTEGRGQKKCYKNLTLEEAGHFGNVEFPE
jgi:hypothetical protein